MEERHRINFSWLVTLRWGATAGQIAIILIVDRVMGIDLPLLRLAVIIGVGIVSNAVCATWQHRVAEIREWMLALVMLGDVVLLTALLYCTGGPFNPFSFLYLVNIALAAVVLRPPWTWALVTFSLACFAALFLDHVPLSNQHAGAHGQPMWMHLQGMWVAFGVASGFIVYFIQRVTRALAARDAELAAARSLSARHEKLASLAALAAGAAHELATPLSTIAVVAKELERQLEGADAVDDARLIRQQVERCREILVQMAADAGESTGEAIVPVTLEVLLDAATDGLGDAGLRREVAPAAHGRTLLVPPRAVAQALRGVLKNARQASSGEAAIVLRADLGAEGWRITVRDGGTGMTPEVLAHAGEPFFTTKNGDGPDRGMGLGLFLTRVVLERLGGRLELESKPGRGTTATMLLPAAAATICRMAEPAEEGRF